MNPETSNQPDAVGPAHPAALAPPPIPDYELIRRIGGGAYGEVWLARSATGVFRALKIVYRRTFDDDRPYEREFEGIQHFERISRGHPGQLALFHVGRGEGYFYYVMELADAVGVQRPKSEGQSHPNSPLTTLDVGLEVLDSRAYAPHTLRADLTGGRLPVARVLEIGLTLTEALAHLHAHGLVHRDVKPSNIIFVNGRPKLADIGLVTDASDSRSIVGTEGYLMPEGPGTPQADLFALGKVLYEAATGLDRRKFPQLPPDLRTWPEASQIFEINEILLKACATNPRDRYANAEGMRADLALLEKGKSVRRKRTNEQRWAACRKTGLVILALAIAAAAALPFLRDFRDRDQHSNIPEVDGLVTQGFTCVKTPDRTSRARDFFNAAVKLDPTFVPAYWGLCQAAVSEGGVEQNAEAKRELRSLAAKLMEIAPDRAESRVASSCVKWVNWDFPGAVADAQSATRMPATCQEARANAHNLYGYYLLQTGRPEQALVEYKLAGRLDPAMARSYHHLGHPYFVQRKFEEALKHYQQAIYFQPSHTIAHYFIGRVYEEKGVVAAANGLGDEEKGNFVAAIQEFETKDLADGKNEADTKRFYDALREAVQQGGGKAYWRTRLDLALQEPEPPLYRTATLHARLGEKDEAYAWLRKACEKKAFDQGLMFDLCWDHNDEEFKAIARSIGLLQ